MTKQRPRVVVVGGGYAGTLAANHLRTNRGIEITLVNPRPIFVERIRLHQLVAGTDTAIADYGTLLGAGIRLVVDTAARIDAAARRLVLNSGAALDYDYLIYAVGSTATVPPAVPGAAEFAYSVGEFEYAKRLCNALHELPPGAPVTVIGGGLTGIETASELAEQGWRVSLVCGGMLGPSLSRRGRRSVAKTLARLGLDLFETAVAAEVRANAVVLEDGTRLASELTIWTAGFGVPDLARVSGLSTDTLGRLLADETLTSVDDPRIVAAGDAAAPSGHPLRMSCQAANPLGVHAANTVLSRIAGSQPSILRPAFTGQALSLGRRAGTIQLARLDDTPINAYIGGRTAALIKEVASCRSSLWFIRREASKPGSYRWLKGGKRRKSLSAEAAT